jgi:DNA-binding MarR family transcriptional regulator
MRRGEAWKPLRERGGWMRLSERAIFYALLERSDNADCSIPAHMTPGLAQLAEACCCSKSTVATALDHLERHGWIKRKRSKGGRALKTTYQLAEGLACPDSCQKRSGSRTVYGEKLSDSRTPKLSDSHSENRRSDHVSDVGISEGEGRQGSALKRCLICQLPMDPILPANGYGTHPCCDPGEISPRWSPRADSSELGADKLAR